MAEPKLWAVFWPDGDRAGLPDYAEESAWNRMGIYSDDAIAGLKDAGYTCREVRIVPVEEPRTIPGTRITVGQMLAEIAEHGSVREFSEQFNLDADGVRECLLRISDEAGK